MSPAFPTSGPPRMSQSLFLQWNIAYSPADRPDPGIDPGFPALQVVLYQPSSQGSPTSSQVLGLERCILGCPCCQLKCAGTAYKRVAGLKGDHKEAASNHNSADLTAQKPVERRRQQLPKPKGDGPMQKEHRDKIYVSLRDPPPSCEASQGESQENI